MLGSTLFAPELIITDEVLGGFADELCKVLIGHIWWSNRVFEKLLNSFELLIGLNCLIGTGKIVV